MAGVTAAIGAPIVSKSAAEQVVTAPVLVPGELDRERHEYRAENIREIAQSFLPAGKIDAMHAGGEVGYPTESWVAKQDLSFGDRTVREGAWLVSAKVNDDDVWQRVAAGELTGVSVFGPVRAVYDADDKELDIGEIARPVGPSAGAGGDATTPATAMANSFADADAPAMELPPAPVGTSWTVEFESADFVSIVDDPAVQAASFVVAKSATSGGSGGDGSGSNKDELIMDDETEERFEKLEALVQKSADSAEAAQTAAEEAVEAGDGDGDDDDGGSGGGTVDAVADLRTDLENAGILGDEGGDGGADDPDLDLGDDVNLDLGDDVNLDEETVEALADAGVIDEDTASELGAPATGVEKRLAAIEKALSDGTGRRGSATQLDLGDDEGEDGTGGLVSSADRAAAIKSAGSASASATAGGEGGDDE